MAMPGPLDHGRHNGVAGVRIGEANLQCVDAVFLKMGRSVSGSEFRTFMEGKPDTVAQAVAERGMKGAA